jgi:hypothetical protein
MERLGCPSTGTHSYYTKQMFEATQALHRIESGACACEGCTGPLTAAALSPGGWRFCRECRCAWRVSAIDGHDYATTVPAIRHVGRQ